MPTNQPAAEILQNFLDNRKDQESLAFWLNRFAELCAAGAEARGFHEDEHLLRSCAEHGLFEGTFEQERPLGQKWIDKNLAWFDSAILQAELARQASEIGEAVEAVRKPSPDQHCPSFSSFLVEEADVLIRVGDTCGKRDLPLGEATVAKLLYNMTRPWKHGKQS